ncbi:hypothetical protein MRB53_026548 [Persea americana]|uniref:Uncharacterized protein n=1 Tax=Persea americana TaxID=3435 RepID=A0ACC2LJF3_PERAE|nr:hypothetical protein MRB53_026548 [Persea americana]
MMAMPTGVASLATPGTNVIGRTREGSATSNTRLDAGAKLTSSNAVLDAVTLSASPADAGEIKIGGFAAPSNAPVAHLSSSNTLWGVTTMTFPSNDAGGKITLDAGALDTPSSDIGGASRKGLPASGNRLDVEASPSTSNLDVDEIHNV